MSVMTDSYIQTLNLILYLPITVKRNGKQSEATMQIETTILNVPCTIDAVMCQRVNGNPTSWDSPEDYSGEELIEFNIMTILGNPFPWLQERLTEEDKSRIKQMIVEQAEIESCEPN